MLILGLILALAGASIYAAVSRSLFDEVDSNLLARSEQALPFLFPAGRGPGGGGNNPGGGGGGPGGPGRRPCEGYSGGIFCVALGPDGSVRANPQEVSLQALTWPDSSQPTFATVDLGDGDQARVLLRRTF